MAVLELVKLFDQELAELVVFAVPEAARFGVVVDPWQIAAVSAPIAHRTAQGWRALLRTPQGTQIDAVLTPEVERAYEAMAELGSYNALQFPGRVRPSHLPPLVVGGTPP